MYQCYIFFKFKFFKRYNIMDRGKRQRLSGSQYKKIRLQREANSAKQKNALLHFLSRSSSEKALAPIVRYFNIGRNFSRKLHLVFHILK